MVDFLSYKNTFKNEPLHNQAKVVMISIGNQNTFYIFYVTNDEATSIANQSGRRISYQLCGANAALGQKVHARNRFGKNRQGKQ